jgi:hypothetical protein
MQAAEHLVVNSLPALCQLLIPDGTSDRARKLKADALQKALAAALATPVS